MQIISKSLKVRLYATFILTGLAIALITISIFTAMDGSTGYFKPSLIYSIAKALAVVTVALALLSCFTIPKGQLSGDSPLTLPVVFPSAFFALVMFVGGIILLGCSILDLPSILDIFSSFTSAGYGILLANAVLNFLMVVYFVLNCFPQNGQSKQIHALIGFSIPVAIMLWIAVSYFDMSVSMNTPIKNLTHLALIAYMIWSGYELRSMLGKAMPRIYFCMGLIVIFFSGASSLPWLIGYLSGRITDPSYPSYILYSIITLAIFAYSSVKITVFVLARDLYERIADQTPPELPEEVGEAPEKSDEIAEPDQTDDHNDPDR